MAMTEENRIHVEDLLRRGRRTEAIRYLRDLFSISESDAEKITDALATQINPGEARINRMRRIMLKSLAMLMMIAGFLSFAGVSLLIYLHQQTVRTSDHIQGKVMALQYNAENAGAPLITYRRNGEEVVFESSEFNAPPVYHAGQTVWLYVSRKDGSVLIDDSRRHWASVGRLALAGAAGVAFSIVFSQFARRKF